MILKVEIKSYQSVMNRSAAAALFLLLLVPSSVCSQEQAEALRFMPAILAASSRQTETLPAAGNPDGSCPVPADAMPEDTANPDHVIGNGTAGSCTSEAVIAAVAQGGIITFDCGPHPVTIVMEETAKIVNNTGPGIVIDGGGKVTLSGNNSRRILYMNTCDPDQVWTTSHCQNQDHPQLTVQNLTFRYGNAKSETTYDGGGAIWVRGGRFKIVNSRFFNNVCADTGPDTGGAAVRVLSQYENLPVYVVNSTFGGRDDWPTAVPTAEDCPASASPLRC